MAIDRNRLEQEALKLLQRGQNERALDRYLTLLRDKPRDLRVRQQVADLYLKVGQKGKAEQHLREIARFHKNSGKARAAIGVYKQILRIKPDDTALYGDLGECYESAGFPKEARQSFERVVNALAKYNPDKAVPYQQRLIALQPGNLPVQVRLAELYEQSNWAEKAQDEWRRLAREARRHGKLDDRARFLRKSLAMRDSVEIALEAAEAHADIGEFDAALPLLQAVTSARAEDPTALTLLARTLTGLGATDKARQVWLVVARLHLASGDASARAEALNAALEAGADDATLQAEVAAANLQAERVALRLTERPWADPGDDTAGMLVVQAGVYATYGFADKAVEALQEDPQHLQVLAVQAALVEALAAAGKTDEAREQLRSIVAPTDEARTDLRIRALVLEGRPEDIDRAPEESPLLDDDDELLDDELLDDELLDDEATDPGPIEDDDALLDEDDELLDDELVDDDPTVDPAPPGAAAADDDDDDDDGDNDGDDDNNDGLSDLFGGALGGEPEPAPEPPGADDGLSSLFGGALSTPAPAPVPVAAASAATTVTHTSGALGDAEALLRVGAFDEAAAMAGSCDSLFHALMLARVARARGDWPGALSTLRDAIDDAAEDDAGYLDGLVEMAELTAARGKRRSAGRLLSEVEDIDPSHQAARVASIRRGLELLAR